MEMIESKKGMSGNTLGQVVTAVVVVIVASISAVILTSINAGQTAGSAAANVTRDGNTMLTNFSSLFGRRSHWWTSLLRQPTPISFY